MPDSGGKAGLSPSFVAAASVPTAMSGGGAEAGPSPSAAVFPAGEATGSEVEPLDLTSGRGARVENGGLDGAARLGEALQQQCFLVLPDHPLSAGRGLQGERGIMASAPASGSGEDTGGRGRVAADPGVGSGGSASLGSHVGSGKSVHDPIDLLQDDIPLSPPILPVPPVPLPEASPSPAHWTLSALIEHLHGAVLPSLPPAAPGSPDGPAHLVRYYYRGIPGSASAPAALDAAAEAGEGGAGGCGLVGYGGAPGASAGGFLKPDTEVRCDVRFLPVCRGVLLMN